MKIALVVTGGLHPSGTSEVIPLLVGLVERLARTHDVHAFVLRHLPKAASYPLAGATVHDLGRPRGRWSEWRALRHALAARGSFDVIHGWWADPAGLAAVLAGRRLGIPAIVSCNSGEFVSLPAIEYGSQRLARGRMIVRLACSLATRVHVTTRYMESQARAHAANPVRIPVGIDVSRWRAANPSDGPPWRLLQVASLNRVKDQSTLLRAVAESRRHLNVQLDLVGEDTLSGRLQREASSLGLDNVVRFHGFVAQEALVPTYESAHLYVQSSLHEASGVSVLEAAASGLAVVGTRAGYVSDWAPDAAWAVPPGDADALAAAIVRLLTHPEQRLALAVRAREWVAAHDLDTTTRALTDLYAESIAHP